MTKFDFGSLKTEDRKEILSSSDISVKRKKKTRISPEKLQQELNKLKKEVDSLKQKSGAFSEDNNDFIPSLHELNICYLGLCRVIKQLSGNRSSDYRNQAIPVKEKLERYLIKKGIITKGE